MNVETKRQPPNKSSLLSLSNTRTACLRFPVGVLCATCPGVQRAHAKTANRNRCACVCVRACCLQISRCVVVLLLSVILIRIKVCRHGHWVESRLWHMSCSFFVRAYKRIRLYFGFARGLSILLLKSNVTADSSSKGAK